MKPYLIRALAGCILLFAAGSLFKVQWDLAGNKPFWLDEGYELHASCGRSFGSLLVEGAFGQSSPQPLYYVAQKTSVESVSLPSPYVRQRFRLVSLLSAVGVTLAVFGAVAAALGPQWAPLSLVFLFNSPVFFQYGAENRPYMLWVFLFAALFALVCGGRGKTWGMPWLAITGMMLTLTSGPGMLQAAALLLTAAWLREVRWKFALPCAASFLLVGSYYSRGVTSFTTAGEFDLWLTHDLGLIAGVLRLFWPKGSPLTWFWNGALALAFIWPLSRWRVYRQLEGADRRLFALTTHLWVQLGVVFVMMFLVAWKHYYFIPRVFMPLLVLRAFGVPAGVYLLFRAGTSRLPLAFRKPAMLTAVVMVAGLFLEGAALWRSHLYFSTPAWAAPSPSSFSLTAEDCAKLRGSVRLRRGDKVLVHEAADFLWTLSRLLEACPHRSGAEVSDFVLIDPSKSGPSAYRILPVGEKSEAPVVNYCARTAVFRVDGGRLGTE